ncbi:hypothetical protein RU96_GL002026 [Enterococcus canintestini]|uniref:Uncharacterized protein n=1 Tax=Enterococcus canintestini TaxID=317010 RepID=A0A1L8R7J0_9ENTE|nr:hypothetical protein RU96_GL002026 [Enterococcus canintestini]
MNRLVKQKELKVKKLVRKNAQFVTNEKIKAIFLIRRKKVS